jgi:hypothetical protein
MISSFASSRSGGCDRKLLGRMLSSTNMSPLPMTSQLALIMGYKLHQSGEELEGGVGFARQHVADGGVAEVDGLSQLVGGDPVMVEHLMQPVGEAFQFG